MPTAAARWARCYRMGMSEHGDRATPGAGNGSITDADRSYLRRCVDLAAEAVDAGDEAFGSLLVDEHGTVLFEDRNRVVEKSDPTQHPEFAIARWAVQNLSAQQRERAVVYTSGEHCAMCSAAHAWVGLGRIVYATGTAQLTAWNVEWGIESGPIAPLPIGDVAPGISAAGPVEEFASEVRALHERALGLTR